MTAFLGEHNRVSLLLLFCCVSLHKIPCDTLYFSHYNFPTCLAFYMIFREEAMFYCSSIFHANHMMNTGTLTLLFLFICLFVSVVPIFPHKSQREGLSVHVNFCVGSLLYSRFIITIVTFYCRIGKLCYILIEGSVQVLCQHFCREKSVSSNMLTFFVNILSADI